MNKGAKGISYTHLFQNNVVPLVLGDFVIACKISIKEVTSSPSMVHVTSPQPRKGCHLGSHACKPCHQTKRGKPRRIRGRHADITWTEGPTGTQTASKPSGHQEPTWGPTGQPPHKSTCQGGPTRGRPNWPCVGPSWPSTWWSLVGPGVHSRGVALPPQVVQGI
jgi:hypothetical protein